ncbi:MAG: ABC transporter permease [Phycisphaerae bacterium]|nr:ABC transporter permease [Phycisphaerae bacterium]
MFFFKICMMALQSLWANLLRTLLATLGVIIGVAAVVSAMSILDGANREILQQLESMGADQLVVLNGSSRRHGRQSMLPSLEADDLDAIRECKFVKAVAPEVQSAAQIKYFSKNTEATVLGTTESYTTINNYKPSEGRFLTREDVRAARKVCVLGHRVAEELFGQTPAGGFRVKIKGQGFNVVGVMEKKGVLGFRDVDNQVMIPLTTAMKRVFGFRNLTMITVQADSAKHLKPAIQQVSRALRKAHGIRAGQDDDFNIFTQEEIKSKLDDMTKIFALVLYSIAGISLVVGGIGIMNIMLVSVTERTREIGVRIAVGARPWDIRKQFLIEASIISVMGGALGVLLGLVFADLMENWTTVLKTYTASSTIWYALIMATSVGVISGLYPAYRASSLDPVEALRYE